MNKAYETIELGEKEFNVNGVKAIATLKAYLHYDEDFELDWDFEPGEKEKIQNQIESGELVPTWIQVVATYGGTGIIGADTLSGCLLGQSYPATQCIDDSEMIENALDELTKEILIMVESMERFRVQS